MSEYLIKLTDKEIIQVLEALANQYAQILRKNRELSTINAKSWLTDSHAASVTALFRNILDQTDIPCPICQGHHTTAGEG